MKYRDFWSTRRRFGAIPAKCRHINKRQVPTNIGGNLLHLLQNGQTLNGKNAGRKL